MVECARDASPASTPPRGGSALPHPVGLQPQAAALAARRATEEEEEEEVQALGADVAGTRG